MVHIPYGEYGPNFVVDLLVKVGDGVMIWGIHPVSSYRDQWSFETEPALTPFLSSVCS